MESLLIARLSMKQQAMLLNWPLRQFIDDEVCSYDGHAWLSQRTCQMHTVHNYTYRLQKKAYLRGGGP